jgi:hypothetical protein
MYVNCLVYESVVKFIGLQLLIIRIIVTVKSLLTKVIDEIIRERYYIEFHI